MEGIKKVIRKTPLIGPLSMKIAKSVGYKQNKHTYIFNRSPINENKPSLNQVKNLLNYTKTSETFYAATNFPAGYHTLNIEGEVLKGRRNPEQRLSKLNYSFKDKTVLDIGTNQGGMLFQLKDELRWGVGIDYDPRMINVANKIKRVHNINNFDFYHFNLDHEPLDLIKDFVPEQKIDIIFLLAVCRWIEKWQDVIKFCANNSNNLLIETNGSIEEQKNQINHVKKYFPNVEKVSNSSDDPERSDRQLFLCNK